MKEPKYKKGDKILITLERQLAFGDQVGVLTDDSGNYEIRLEHMAGYRTEESYFGIEIMGEICKNQNSN